jgi:hypothetical protein
MTLNTGGRCVVAFAWFSRRGRLGASGAPPAISAPGAVVVALAPERVLTNLQMMNLLI